MVEISKMTIFKLEKRVKALEGKLCCIAHYYDTFEDFPEEGNENVLYVDKETGGYIHMERR